MSDITRSVLYSYAGVMVENANQWEKWRKEEWINTLYIYVCIYTYMINIYSKIDVSILNVFKAQINLSFVVRKNTVIS